MEPLVTEAPADPELAALHRERQVLLLERERHGLKLQVKALRSAAGMPARESHGDMVADSEASPRGKRLMEDWGGYGGYVDTFDYVNDDPNFGFVFPNTAYSLRSDRENGQYWPVYRNEQHLAWIRGRTHFIRLLTPTLDGILNRLTNYVLGEGMTFEIQEREAARGLYGDVDLLIKSVQRVIDEFIDDHGFDGTGLDCEAHKRSREDGECFIPIEWSPRKKRPVARFVECDNITRPPDEASMDSWLGFDDEFPTDWNFGVHTAHDKTNEVHGYFCVYDLARPKWQYFPDEFIPESMTYEAREKGKGAVSRMQHIKLNVPANAKRGVSDFFPMIGELIGEAKLRRNTREGAALQAAIAFITQTPAGTSPGQADAVGSQDFFTQYNKPVQFGGLKPQNVNRYSPGTVLRVSEGLEYLPGPMGAERNAGFIDVGQLVLRMIGMFWAFPEAMISGDASNANFASSLVAESPFVKAREHDQRLYARHFKKIMWKVIRMAWEMGRFDDLGISWATLEHLLEIKVDAPAVATRDEKELVETLQMEVAMGICSLHTAAAERGRDLDAEIKLGAHEQAPATAVPGMPKAPGGDGGDNWNQGTDDGKQPQDGDQHQAANAPNAGRQPQEAAPQVAPRSPADQFRQQVHQTICTPPQKQPLQEDPQVLRAPQAEAERQPTERQVLIESAQLVKAVADAIRPAQPAAQATPSRRLTALEAATAAALESVETTEEARQILQDLRESEPDRKSGVTRTIHKDRRGIVTGWTDAPSDEEV